MKADASFFLNISGSSSAPWLPFELIVRLRPLFVLQNHITWIKSIATKGDAVGHFKPVGGQRFLHHNHEHIFHLTLSGDVKLDRLAIGVPFKDKSNIARRGHAKDLRCRGNTWFIPYDTVQSKAAKFHHPSTFPVALPRWCIRLHGRSNAVVLDPFMGTGTTLVAAELEGASGIGIDLDPAMSRLRQARLVEAGHVQPDLVGRLTWLPADRASHCLSPAWSICYRPTVGFAAIRLLEQAGCQVEVPRAQTCCGQPAYNSGDRSTARDLGRGHPRCIRRL